MDYWRQWIYRINRWFITKPQQYLLNFNRYRVVGCISLFWLFWFLFSYNRNGPMVNIYVLHCKAGLFAFLHTCAFRIDWCARQCEMTIQWAIYFALSYLHTELLTRNKNINKNYEWIVTVRMAYILCHFNRLVLFHCYLFNFYLFCFISYFILILFFLFGWVYFGQQPTNANYQWWGQWSIIML